MIKITVVEPISFYIALPPGALFQWADDGAGELHIKLVDGRYVSVDMLLQGHVIPYVYSGGRSGVVVQLDGELTVRPKD